MLSAATAHILERLKGKAQWTASFSFTRGGHYGVLCLAILFAACSGLIQPVVSIYMGRYSDALAQFGGGLIDSSTLHDRAMVGVHAFIVLGFCTLITNAGMFATWTIFGEMQAKSVREELFRSLLEKDLEWFEQRESGIASLLTRLQTQIRDLQHGTSQPFGFVLQSLIEGFAAFVVAMSHGWKLAMVILSCLPLSATVLYLISRGTQTHIESQNRYLIEASQVSNNAISNVSLVKCFNTQGHETARYVTAVGEAAIHSLKQSRVVAAQIGAAGFLIFAMFMLGFWYGSRLVHDGDITAGKAITTIWATFMSVSAFQTLVPHITSLAKGHAAAMALRELLETVHRGRRSHRRLDGVSPETCEGGIEVCQVSFAYPSRPSHHVLQGCSLQFPAGRITFLVGRSGSGKSTLGTLLVRCYSSSSGAIFIDGHDIEDLDTSWLRNNITCVHQDSALFNETIKTNIALGHRYHKDVTPAQIQDCISLAALEDVIATMPFGMDSPVGAGGSALSGGQIQRVVLARARLRNTPILILDESTSALDHANRARVVQEIRRWREGLTTIIITHDLTQIGEEDFVYVLEDGKVSREGRRCRISHTLLARSTTRETSRVNTTTESTQTSSDTDKDQQAREHRRPPNLRWKKEGTTLRASFEQQLDNMDTGDYPQSPKKLLLTSRLTTLFGNGASERIRSSDAVQRHTRTLEDVQRPRSIPPLPDLPDAGDRASQDIEMRPISLHPNLAVRSSQQPSLNGEPLRSPRLLEKSGIRYLAKLGGSSFSKIEDAPSQMSLQAIYSTLLVHMDRNHWVKLGVGFVAVCCRAVLPAVFSFVVARMFETFYMQENYRSKALKWTMVQLVVALVDGTAAFSGQYLLEAAARRWADRLRAEAMKRVLEQPMPWFEQDQHGSSILLSILDRDAEGMRTLLSRFAALTINVVIMMTVAIIWSFASCWKLTLVALATTPAIYGLARCFDRVSNLWAAQVNSAADSIGTVFVETFTDIQTVRSFTLESYFHLKYNRAIGAAFATGRSRALITGGLFGLSESTINFAVALLLWYATRLLSTFDFGMVSVLTSAFLLIISSGQASVIFGIIPRVAEAADSATRLIRLTQLDPTDEGEQDGKETLGEHLNSTGTAIKFSQMFFAYPSRPLAPALKGLDLSVATGECVAVVGRSGGGKSTIASLLVGLYQSEPNIAEGPPLLTIFGQDARSLDLASLRKTVVMVPQDPVIFRGTVWENICYGLEPHTRFTTSQNVNWAATQAAIHDFVLSLPNQYDTVIGEGGLGVSGGQAQRIALARALVRRPKILVLDEATSALDNESADLIRSSIRSHIRTSMTGGSGDQMTIVIISHAREMMQVADKVIMLEEGRVVEEGAYEALMTRRGKLHQMLNGTIN